MNVQAMNPQKTLLVLALYGISTCLFAQNKINAFYIGHSLSDQIPDMVASLSNQAKPGTFNWTYQGIPGAPLRWQWQRKTARDYTPIPPHYYGFYDRSFGLSTGKFDVLVLTESVPRYQRIIDETYQYADSFYVYATRFNPNIQVYLYEDWHCLDSGTPTGCDYDVNASKWRQRLSDDLLMWESVVSYLNNKYKPSKPVCMIPAAQGLARLYDLIPSGALPGIGKIEDLFGDRIHLNDVGKYFVACVHYAAIHRKSPEGLGNQLQVWWGGNFKAPSPALAAKMQSVAWETVKNYPKNCLNQTTVALNSPPANTVSLEIWPNPVADQAELRGLPDGESYYLYNALGQIVYQGKDKTLNVRTLEPGLYVLRSRYGSVRLVKQ